MGKANLNYECIVLQVVLLQRKEFLSVSVGGSLETSLQAPSKKNIRNYLKGKTDWSKKCCDISVGISRMATVRKQHKLGFPMSGGR